MQPCYVRSRNLRGVEALCVDADREREPEHGKRRSAELKPQRGPENGQDQEKGVGGVCEQFPRAEASEDHGDGDAFEKLRRGWPRPFAPSVDG